jgi:ribosomal protein S18 acetylase RimI-like enzyme
LYLLTTYNLVLNTVSHICRFAIADCRRSLTIDHSLFTIHHMTPQQLQQAAAHNHQELFHLTTQVSSGEVHTRGGLTWTYIPGKDNHPGNGVVPFPNLSVTDAGTLLDDMMDWYRRHPVTGVGCWSLLPQQPADLGIRLLARGFQPGWQPGWLSLNLQQPQPGFDIPDGLNVLPDNETPTHNLPRLPYSGDSGAISNKLLAAYPARAQRFLAWLNGEIVGQSCVFFSTGPLAAAGIYNVGVVTNARQQGIGKAVVRAATKFAQEKGYQYAVLNGTGRRMYEQLGFKWQGFGATWWLMSDGYLTNPPSPTLVAFTEAVGRGDIALLDQLHKQLSPEQLRTPLANRMTFLQLAEHFQQSTAIEWLTARGSI